MLESNITDANEAVITNENFEEEIKFSDLNELNISNIQNNNNQ